MSEAAAPTMTPSAVASVHRLVLGHVLDAKRQHFAPTATSTMVIA
ncbi:hypothetical protein TGAMA5MH_10288 [Trichoderma gamsii]|uniref:Uncharacterized protein n=1 Tax=Trichoderma gamsii TaxID=398673 RepID=A0A2K0SX06_9HYPO|nr:hypothetical protein TGAMA5MH_10288 [Trichoderma gamsii]